MSMQDVINNETPNRNHWQQDPETMRKILGDLAISLDNLWSNLGLMTETQINQALLDLQTQINHLTNTKENEIVPGAAILNAATSAATNALVSLSIALLGTLVTEVATKYNDLATKFNNLLNTLRAQGLLAA